jgi:hypothetical protein
MYSSTNPQFEKLWGAWDGVDLSKARVIYTVRNDDINTLRWADFSFIRDYVRGMKKDYVEGFYGRGRVSVGLGLSDRAPPAARLGIRV